MTAISTFVTYVSNFEGTTVNVLFPALLTSQLNQYDFKGNKTVTAMVQDVNQIVMMVCITVRVPYVSLPYNVVETFVITMAVPIKLNNLQVIFCLTNGSISRWSMG